MNTTTDAHYAGVNLHGTSGLFNCFFTTKENGKGIGLGPFTSMAVVKSDSGFVQAYSEMGRCSNFNPSIPARAAATNDVGLRAFMLPQGRGELVLVVDDETAARLITQQTLEAYPYRAVVVVDGAVPVAVYARLGDELAAVLTDMTMPMMNGPPTIRVLRTTNSAVRIITASAPSANANGAELGSSLFLPKPYAADRLLTTLQAAVYDGPERTKHYAVLCLAKRGNQFSSFTAATISGRRVQRVCGASAPPSANVANTEACGSLGGTVYSSRPASFAPNRP